MLDIFKGGLAQPIGKLALAVVGRCPGVYSTFSTNRAPDFGDVLSGSIMKSWIARDSEKGPIFLLLPGSEPVQKVHCGLMGFDAAKKIEHWV